MLTLEIRRWLRSNKAMLLFLLYIFIALSSTISTYYANDILKSMISDNEIVITLPDINITDILSSFYKNSTQIGIFVSLYLILSMSNTSKTDSLKMFFETRTLNRFKVQWPKLISSLIIMVVCLISGIVITILVTYSLYNTVNFKEVAFASVLHITSVLIIIIIGFLINVLLESPFVISGTIEIMILILSSIGNIEALKKYTGIEMLIPTSVLENRDLFFEKNESIYFYSAYLLLIIVIVALLEILRRKIRHDRTAKN